MAGAERGARSESRSLSSLNLVEKIKDLYYCLWRQNLCMKRYDSRILTWKLRQKNEGPYTALHKKYEYSTTICVGMNVLHVA